MFEDDDVDLQHIFKNIKSTLVPPDMQLLWNEQMKQLSTKSTKAYRWNPRLETLYVLNYCHVAVLIYTELFVGADVKQPFHFCIFLWLNFFFFRVVRFALDLYCKNPKALDSMREFVILPSKPSYKVIIYCTDYITII